MIVNIENVRKFKNFNMHEQSMPIEGVDYGVAYVLATNKEWSDAIKQAREDITNLACYRYLHIESQIVEKDFSQWPRDNFLKDKNLFVPLFTPDRYVQCYLTGTIPDTGSMEKLLLSILLDAYYIGEQCSIVAFDNLGNWDAIDSSGINAEKCEVDNISLRGRVTDMSFLLEGERTVKNTVVSYAERIKKLKELPMIAKRIRSESNNEAKESFVELWACLTDSERRNLSFELLKRSKPKDIKDIIGATVDRDTMGRRSRFTIVIRDSQGGEEFDNFDSDYMLCTYLKDAQDRLIPLRFSHTTQVLYTMSLINKKCNPNVTPAFRLIDNKEAFFSIFAMMFGKTYKPDLEKEYAKLFSHETFSKSIHSGSLSDRYNEIRDHLTDVFRNLGENPLPYITREDYPLAISAEKIEISHKLKDIKVILR